MLLEPLYKRTTKGAVQVWQMEIDEANGRYRTISGQLDGKHVTSAWTEAKPKNTGRANATTAAEQAIAEGRAAWDKKQRDGYSMTIDAAHGSTRVECMTADFYVDQSAPHKSRKPRVLAALERGERVFSQPKLDGVRLLASKGSMLSRTHRPITAFPHVAEALAPVFERHPNLMIDGELYQHALRDDFNKIVSIVRRQKVSAKDAELAKTIDYCVYDCVTPGIDEPYAARLEAIANLLADIPHVCVVPTDVVRSEEEIDRWYMEYLKEGYEGQMIRLDAPYEHRRSDKLLKRKEHEDTEFVVVDIGEGEGNFAGQAGFVIIQDKVSGAISRSNIKSDEAVRLELFANKRTYVGGEVTVRFNGRTPDGIPRCPRAVAWYPGRRNV